jgi:hypothetical protein
MIATIESIDFTSWLFRLIGAKKHKHKSATRMGKWAVTFVVLAAALLTLPLYGQQTTSGDSAGTDVPVNQVAGVTNPTMAALDSGAVAAPSSSQGGADPQQTVTDPIVRGVSVFHCHLLKHEDKGMMAKILFE